MFTVEILKLLAFFLKQVASLLWTSSGTIPETFLPLARVLAIDRYVFDEVVGLVKLINKTFTVTIF